MKKLFKSPLMFMAILATAVSFASCDKPTTPPGPNPDDPQKEDETTIVLSSAQAMMVATGTLDQTIVVFEGDDYKLQAYLVNIGKEGLELTEGTFTVNVLSDGSNTALTGRIQDGQTVGTTVEDLQTGDVYLVEEGEIEIKRNGNSYEIDADLTLEDGIEMEFTYKGEFEVADMTKYTQEPEKPVTKDIVFTTDTITNIGGIFSNLEMDALQISLRNDNNDYVALWAFVSTGETDFLGTYEFVNPVTGEAKTGFGGYYDFSSNRPLPSIAITSDGNIYYITEGSVTVAADKTSFSVKTGKGSSFTGTYNGAYVVGTKASSAPMQGAKKMMTPSESAKLAAYSAFIL